MLMSVSDSMFSPREREAIILGVIVGITAFAMQTMLAESSLWLHILAIILAGSIISGIATFIK
jgi:uncharacterized protein (DUF983 family)